MSSNEILFNSAALHSLKRTQLVKICKRHGLKASGKNAELIQRLEEYAKNLSDDSALPGAFDVPTSDAPAGDDDDDEEDDEDDNASTTTKTPSRNLGTISTRPSEPWSVLEEDQEPKSLFPTVNSQQTGKTTIAITTTGLAEFGTETQPLAKSSSVGSSLRAFATSLKRVATIGSSSSLKSKSSSQDVQNPEPAPTSAPARSSLSPSPEPPAPQPQPSTYCPDPSLASSTIRLIPSSSSSNLLSKAGEPGSSDSGTKNDASDSNEFMVPTKFDDDSSCDEDFGTEDPAQKRKSSLYPELPEFARITAAASSGNLLPGGFPSVDFSNFSFAAATTTPTADDQPAPTTTAPPVPAGVKNTTMAATIMEEMNRRMGIDPNSSAAIGFGIFDKKPVPTTTAIAPSTRGAERFDKAHDSLFDKMDSIANHYAARRNPSKARKSVSRTSTNGKPRSSLSATPAAVKRRSQASEAGKRVSRTSLIAASDKRLFSPPPAGSSAPQDDVPMEEDETDESFAHVGIVTGGDGKKRVTICSPESDEEDEQAMPGGFFGGPSASKPAAPRPSKQVKVAGPNLAEKRRVNHAKAKRRSSAARASMGRASIVGASAVKQVAPQPAKTGGKFGFLKSGAKLVKSLWGGSKATPAAKPAPAATKEKSRVWGYGGGAAAADKGKAKATVGTTASTTAGVKSPTPATSTAAVQKLTSTALAAPTTNPSSTAAPKTTTAAGARTSNPGLAPRPDGSLPKRRIVSGSSAAARKSSSVSTTGIGLRSITTPRPPVPPPTGVSPIGGTRTRPSSLATGKTAATASNPARNSSAAPAGKKSVGPPTTSAAGTNFGFDLDRARSPPGAGVKKPSTLTMPTASSLAKMQSNAKPPANENQSVKSPPAPSFHNFGFKGSPARVGNNATGAAAVTSPKVAMPSGIPSPFKMPSTLGAITNTVDEADDDGDQAMADDQNDDFNLPPESKSAANTINTIASSVSGASLKSSRSLGKRPKIERAKVMAKLEEKRAAAAAAASTAASTGAAGSRSSVIGLPASVRDPALAQPNSRRSHGTAALAGTPTRRRREIELAVQLSAKKAAIRKSEAAARTRLSQTSDVSMSSIYGGMEM